MLDTKATEPRWHWPGRYLEPGPDNRPQLDALPLVNLHHLPLGRAGARFQRISQELEASAAAVHGAAVWRLQPLFQPAGVAPDQLAAARQVTHCQ